MILPSRRFALILLGGACLLAAGAVWPPLALLGIGVDASLVALLVLDVLLSASPRQISATRSLPDPLSVGAPCPVAAEVTNGAGHDIEVELRDALPPTMQPEPRVPTGSVPAGGRARLKWSVTPRRRGEHAVGDLAVRYGTRLGLAVREFTVDASRKVRVYPDVANVNAYALLARNNRLREVGLTPVRRTGEGTQFESLREYQHGDSLRHIEWKATARRGKPISKSYEVERSQNVMVMVDTGRLMTSEFRGMSRLDYVLNASLMLSYVALRHGDSVGVLAFSDRIETFLPLRRGPGVSRRILEALHGLRATLCESDYRLAFRFLATRSRKRSLVLLFTDVLDRRASSSVLSYMSNMARHHRPLCITLGDPEVTELARSSPDSVHEAYVKVVAAGLVRARENALRAMRRRGVSTLDVLPDRLTVATVNKYLALKRRLKL